MLQQPSPCHFVSVYQSTIYSLIPATLVHASKGSRHASADLLSTFLTAQRNPSPGSCHHGSVRAFLLAVPTPGGCFCSVVSDMWHCRASPIARQSDNKLESSVCLPPAANYSLQGEQHRDTQQDGSLRSSVKAQLHEPNLYSACRETQRLY